MIPNFDKSPSGYDPISGISRRFRESYIGYKHNGRVDPYYNNQIYRDKRSVKFEGYLIKDNELEGTILNLEDMDFTYPRLGLVRSDKDIFFVDESPSHGRYGWGVNPSSFQIFNTLKLIQGGTRQASIGKTGAIMLRIVSFLYNPEYDTMDGVDDKNVKHILLSPDFALMYYKKKYIIIYKSFSIGEYRVNDRTSLLYKEFGYLIPELSKLTQSGVILYE